MKEIRWEEQRQAAARGKYSAMVQLKHPSSAIKDPANSALTDELESLLLAASPSVVYTHNLADKHDTHIAVAAAAIRAIRRLPAGRRPERVYGVEIWRALDWLPDDMKVLLDLSGAEETALALIGAFESQIAGGKRYDLATLGRWRANATYFESHGTDTATLVAYAMNLSPLVKDSDLDPRTLPLTAIDTFKRDVSMKLAKYFN
jgi:LmbE family N-acetylglucosaminyl deacetylase